jgi:signal transduction histidine kinase
MPAMIAFSSFVIGCLIALVLSKYFSAHIDVDRTGVVILGSIAAATALLVLGMRRQLRKSHENGPEASQALGRAIVELAALGEAPGSLVKAMEGMRKAIEDLSNVAVVFKIHGADFVKALSPEKRMDLYHIVLEALAGAVRQSRATEVFAVLDAGPEETTFLVKDNGTGFSPDDLEGTSAGHPGLGRIRSRVYSLGGTCVIWSKPETGTIVKVSVPSV